jgi:hypothetical protein
MTTKDILTLAFSGLALGVAGYGILERHAAAFSALRVRITELVAAIEQLNVDEAGYKQSHPGLNPDEWRSVLGSYTGQRALLTYQALALLARLRATVRWKALLWAARLRPSLRWRVDSPYRLTATEHATLGRSLMGLRDRDAARAQWEDAAVEASTGTALVKANVHDGYAAILFAVGDVEEGRRQYRSAVATYEDRWDVFLSFVDWIEAECAAEYGAVDEPVRGAVELANTPSYWQSTAQAMVRDLSAKYQTVAGAVNALGEGASVTKNT